jgi:membrane-associated protease RseP (regulator of RpoE activity)
MDPDTRERRIAGALFLATCCSVFGVYLWRWQAVPGFDGGWRALAFTTTLMGILLAHELGHYAAGRAHGIRLAMPWFLPAPVLVGTFGAIIRWGDVPRTRSALLEMGAMGPLAGLVAVVGVVVVWLWGGPVGEADGGLVLARPLLWWVLSFGLTGAAPPEVSTQDPLAFAAWIGTLVTSMNLLPIGQLDGGHVAAALWPGRARTIARAATVLALVMGLLWPGWAVWVALAWLMGTPSEAPRDARPPDRRARRVAWLTAFAFVSTVTPVPF